MDNISDMQEKVQQLEARLATSVQAFDDLRKADQESLTETLAAALEQQQRAEAAEARLARFENQAVELPEFVDDRDETPATPSYELIGREEQLLDALRSLAVMREENERLKADRNNANNYILDNVGGQAYLESQLKPIKSELALRTQERDALAKALNTPETEDFFKGVPLEAAHQRVRWPSEQDAGKTHADWFWLVGYLAGKCLSSAAAGNTEKALHHTISTAAALANWHRALKGAGDMRPGIAEPAEAVADALTERSKP